MCVEEENGKLEKRAAEGGEEVGHAHSLLFMANESARAAGAEVARLKDVLEHAVAFVDDGGGILQYRDQATKIVELEAEVERLLSRVCPSCGKASFPATEVE